MHVYKAYNLGIHSELSLPEMIVADSSADVVVRLGKLNNSPQIETRGGNYFLAEVPKVAIFSVENGCEIVIDPVPGIDEAILRTFLLGPLLSILLRQRGLLVLHGSCIAIDNGAIAFLGGSGWGKSTLAEAFHSRGYNILTDDLMAIQVETERSIVFPGFPQIKLWPEAAAAIGHPVNSLPLLHSQTTKLAHQFVKGFLQKSLPLKRIYVLAEGSDREIIPLSSQEAFIQLINHSRAIKSLKAPEFMSSHFHQCSTLLKTVSVSLLKRQRSFAELPNLVKFIQEDIDQSIRDKCDSKDILAIPVF